ncbi:MAG TPA: S8 family serine peptidase [Solirubrobacteraceae bacterium]|nr:S8 family serine peptidase [Solirubrobacteraceae bacterium]
MLKLSLAFLVVVAIAALAAAPAGAATVSAGPPPTVLPGDPALKGMAAAAAQWTITAKPGRATRRIARRYRARSIGIPPTAIYLVRRAWARRMVRDLRRVNAFIQAQPNTRVQPRQAVLPDPFDPFATWRTLIVDPALAPPAVSSESPLLALIDSPLDPAHPEFAGGNTRMEGTIPARDSHGTATAAIAGAPKNDLGITGIWPGMRVLNVPSPRAALLCSDVVEQIGAAIAAGASVISLSHGSRERCFAEEVVLQLATGRGIVVVAAAGNGYAEGSPREFPAALPHVFTIGAVGPDLAPAPFTSADSTVDLSAPGVGVLTAVRPGEDGDVERDGYALVSGTSYAAPMVAAAATWLRAVRPGLTAGEVTQVFIQTARDVLEPGWDDRTGFGLPDLRAALAVPPREIPKDPLEPNDEIVWIDGSAFARPDPALGQGNRDAQFDGTVAALEDPADVYRLVLRAGARARIRVKPHYGDVDLAVYSHETRSLSDTRERMAESGSRGGRTERVTVRNRESRARTVYVAITHVEGSGSFNSWYTLTLDRR